MRQTDLHHLDTLMQPALGGLVQALADRNGETDAEYEARATGTWTVVQSLQPRDTIDLMLAGHMVATNELFADSAHDILHGMPDGPKQRARSSAIAMGRLVLAQIAEFERRRVQPSGADASIDQGSAEMAKTPVDEPAETPLAKDASGPASEAEAAASPLQAGTAALDEALADETSWLDEPYQEWLEETPAMLAARDGVVPATQSAPPAIQEDVDDGSADATLDFVLPQPQLEHRQSRPMEAAAA